MKPFIILVFIIGAPASLIFSLVVGQLERRRRRRFTSLHPDLQRLEKKDRGEAAFLEKLRELGFGEEAAQYEAWATRFSRGVMIATGVMLLLIFYLAYIYSLEWDIR